MLTSVVSKFTRLICRKFSLLNVPKQHKIISLAVRATAKRVDVYSLQSLCTACREINHQPIRPYAWWYNLDTVIV